VLYYTAFNISLTIKQHREISAIL